VTRPVLAGVVLIAASLVVAGCVLERDTGDELETMLDRVDRAGAPGALLVVRQDGHRRVDVRGFSDVARARPPGAEERFRVGSITKTFVAALVLRLVEDGKLGLQDPVERWLPGLVPRGQTITVEHLLSHTSGLPDYVEDDRVRRSPQRRWTPRELVAVALAGAEPPERSFAYASTNYIVLGLIAERAGGAPLARQLRDRLFEPLGLDHTSLIQGVVRGPHVHGHRPPTHQGIVTGAPADVSDEPAWWTWAAGGVVSTAEDVHRFFRALLRGQVLSPRLLREMQTLRPAGRLRYGLGIATFPTPCGPAWGHTGNVLGTIAVAWNTKDASRQLVLVVNTYPLSAELETAVRELEEAAFCAGP
jgi:D-alanyl-D-alanine carboxypeptidase